MTDDTAATMRHEIKLAVAPIVAMDAPQTTIHVAPVWCTCGWRADSSGARGTEWMRTGLHVGEVRATYGEFTAELLAAILHLDAVYNIVGAEVVDDKGQP